MSLISRLLTIGLPTEAPTPDERDEAPARFEPLEQRLLLSLTDLALAYPLLAFDSTGVLAYNAAQDSLDVNATPLTLRASPSYPPRTVTADPIAGVRSFQIHIKVDDAGDLVGGVAGDDLLVVGKVTADGPGGGAKSGTLLSGEIISFGALNSSGPATPGTDDFLFLFEPTGGSLAYLYAGSLVGVKLTSEVSTFVGNFAVDFGGGAKGDLGRGTVSAEPAAIGDFVWEDLDADGQQDAGEPGIANVGVRLYDAGNNLVGSTTTGGSGYYLFSGLTPGDYHVEFDAVAGFVRTPGNVGPDVTDSDANASGVAAATTLTSGETDLTWDAGYYRPAAIDIEKYVKGETPCAGGEGLTPGFWKQCHHFYAWTGYEPTDSYEAIFGVDVPSGSPTLLQALWTGGGGVNALLRHSVAALLNASHPNIDYAYTVAQVISMTQGAFATGNFESVKNLFATQNELEADLNENVSVFCVPPPPCPPPGDGYGDDADEPTGPTITEGGLVKFTYVVTNPGGGVQLADVVVIDDNETPGVLTDDFYPDPVLNGTDTHNVGDLDVDGRLDVGETWLYEAFEFATPGQHTNIGSVVGTPVDEAGNPVGGNVMDEDAANYFAAGPTLASLGDYVWHDLHHSTSHRVDGIQDAGEPGIAGVVVNLLNASGNVIGSTITDSTGYYVFSGLAAGTYSAQVAASNFTTGGALQGWYGTLANAGTNDAADSDGDRITHKSGPVTLTAGEHDSTVDFGFFTTGVDLVKTGPGTANVGDTITYHFRVENTGDVVLHGGATVYDAMLNPCGDHQIWWSVVEPGAVYEFDKTYTVKSDDCGELTNEATAKGCPIDPGTMDLPYVYDTSEWTVQVTCRQEASLGDFVWHDLDADGQQDAGEPGIANVGVRLYDAGNNLVGSTTTGGSGYYLFSGLTPGDYHVEFDAVAGFVRAPGNVGPDATDSDANASGVAAATTLTSGETDLTWDAGYYRPAAIGNFVWHDLDADGQQDAGEPGINGVVVDLLNSVGAVIGTTTTVNSPVGGAPGYYQFSSLRPGTYQTRVDASNFAGAGALVGFAASPTGQGGNPALDSNVQPAGTTPVALPSGGSDQTLDFGYYKTVTIRGTKYRDLTGNGLTCDDTSAPLAGVTINLYKDANGNGTLDVGDGGLIASAATAANGVYSFTGLTAGVYFVQEVIVAPYVRTAPTNSSYYTVTATAGGTYSGNDFANFLPGDCRSYVTCISYVVNGTTTYTDLRGYTHQGDVVTAYFTVTGDSPTLSLVSYTALSGAWVPSEAASQEVFQQVTQTFTQPGRYSLTVEVPNSYYQVDFVCGPVIDHFGPVGSNIFYSAQGRLLSADNGGIESRPTTFSSLAGAVYADNNNDGIFQGTESGLPGTQIRLTGTDSQGKTVDLVRTTDASGAYKFSGLQAGTYKLAEVQPAAYLDGKDVLGTQGGTLGNDVFSNIRLGAGINGTNNNFGEIKASSLSGFVYKDADNDARKDCGEISIACVQIKLTGVDDLGRAVSLITTTNSAGAYSFGNLRPGTYTIVEVQPTGLRDGLDSLGTLGGILGNDKFSGIQVGVGKAGINYNFGERSRC